MGISDIIEDVSEWTWKMRCKVFRKGDHLDRNLAEIDAENSPEAGDGEKNGRPAAIKSATPTIGCDPVIKNFYEGKDSHGTQYYWVDYPPKQLSKSVAKANDRVSIRVFKTKDTSKPIIGGKFSLKYHEIQIQNPALVAAIAPMVKKEDVHLDAGEPASFKAPFRPLYFCYDEIIQLWRDTQDGDPLKDHAGLLVRLLDDVFAETRKRKGQLEANGLINYKLAWTYFPRGDTVYCYVDNAEFLCRVETTTEATAKNGAQYLSVKARTLYFNGEAFVWEPVEVGIMEFSGNKPITEVSFYPLRYHKEPKAVTERLMARAKKVLDLQGLEYRSYNGVAVESKDDSERNHIIDGRILVDVFGYHKYHLAQGKREAALRYHGMPPSRPPPAETSQPAGDVAVAGTKQSGQVPKRLSEELQQLNKDVMLALGEDLTFMRPTIEGYAFKIKEWVSLYVDDISPVSWNSDAYDHLVYDDQQKDLVLSFVDSHDRIPQHGARIGLAPTATLQDVIPGKGQGLVVLLSGPPGTGKTLTAEAVADRTKRPLFYLQAEDLGISAATLGANIKRVFEMATDWDAVVLLDEADVFMAERRPHDISRNELVSIFLRELEYFRGIIFLTTNLLATIDSAFRSRVSLHLVFKTLGPDARETLWRKFLDRLPPSTAAIEGAPQGKTADPSSAPSDTSSETAGPAGLVDDEIKELGRWQLNGREIKTAVKMTKAWCDQKGYELTLERLENGIRVTAPHVTKIGTAGEHDDLYDD
ncbi:ATPase [Plectosphaerella plurivora]|uniref:ATPase n=1 Tax=Plectosphaerella plurivora TaxID=936078 RepID=A0A9P8V560_9PEZI|nr:ATPase [Plectosphaerella plurivora]